MGAKGRPTKYNPECNEQVYKLCLLGAIDDDIANFFGIRKSTLTNWKNRHPDFMASIKRGKADADAVIAKALFHRAKGYSHPEEKIMVVDHEIRRVETVKHYPPDPVSMIFWLKNRQPALWRDRTEQTNTIQIQKVDPLDELTVDELRKLAGADDE